MGIPAGSLPREGALQRRHVPPVAASCIGRLFLFFSLGFHVFSSLLVFLFLLFFVYHEREAHVAFRVKSTVMFPCEAQ